MTYSYVQKHHKNYNICYKNYPMKVGEWVLRWTSQDKGDGCRQHPNKREQCADRKCPILRVLGTTQRPQEKNLDKEIQRRIMAGWAAYAKHRDIFKSNIAICLKRQVYNSWYGAETWPLTKQAQNKLAAAYSTTWRPYDTKRQQWRPDKRWKDDLDKHWSDTIWQRKAQDRVIWRRHAEAFKIPPWV